MSTPLTTQTRNEAYSTRPANRCRMILTILGDESLTARDIAYGLGFRDLNAVKPRLTEMLQAGMIETVGKSKDFITGRSVAVYRRKDDVAL